MKTMGVFYLGGNKKRPIVSITKITACILGLKSIGGDYIAVISKKAVRRHRAYSVVIWKLSVKEVFTEKSK